jgi:acetate CoA/acetoacetate CoA-transferase alpha subunit
MIPDGATLMIGGFLGGGTPNRLIDELIRQGKKDLTIIANDTGRPALGIGKLIVAKLVKKVIASHIGTNPETQKQMIEGALEVSLVPQGTLAEQIRASLGGVLTATGIGATVAEGKQRRQESHCCHAAHSQGQIEGPEAVHAAAYLGVARGSDRHRSCRVAADRRRP